MDGPSNSSTKKPFNEVVLGAKPDDPKPAKSVPKKDMPKKGVPKKAVPKKVTLAASGGIAKVAKKGKKAKKLSKLALSRLRRRCSKSSRPGTSTSSSSGTSSRPSPRCSLPEPEGNCTELNYTNWKYWNTYAAENPERKVPIYLLFEGYELNYHLMDMETELLE